MQHVGAGIGQTRVSCGVVGGSNSWCPSSRGANSGGFCSYSAVGSGREPNGLMGVAAQGESSNRGPGPVSPPAVPAYASPGWCPPKHTEIAQHTEVHPRPLDHRHRSVARSPPGFRGFGRSHTRDWAAPGAHGPQCQATHILPRRQTA